MPGQLNPVSTSVITPLSADPDLKAPSLKLKLPSE
jgi:hypothetical protein